MPVSSVNNTYATSNLNSVTNNSYTDKNTLSMDDFFQLLAAELQNQDALNPVSNTEFIGQMAQFSLLSQMQELTSSVQMTYAASLVGKTVSVQSTNVAGTKTAVSGVVDNVIFKSGSAYLGIGNNFYSVSDLLEVKNA